MSDRRSESGQVTLFGIGLVVLLLFVGGVSLDLWRVLSTQRALQELADGAAAAGANGIDTASVWSAADLVLDQPVAEQLAAANLGAQSDRPGLLAASIDASDPTVMVVTVEGEVDLVLLDLFSPAEPISIEVRATARPARGGS